jgi:hypothetical protein
MGFVSKPVPLLHGVCRKFFPAAGLRLKDGYWCCGSLQYRTRPRRFTWVPRAPVSTWRAPVWCSRGRPRGMERVCARAAPQAATVSQCAARGLHPLAGSLRRRLSPRRRRIAYTRSTTRVRVRGCADACSCAMATGRMPLVWRREQPHDPVTPKILLRVYNQDGSGEIVQKPFMNYRSRCPGDNSPILPVRLVTTLPNLSNLRRDLLKSSVIAWWCGAMCVCEGVVRSRDFLLSADSSRVPRETCLQTGCFSRACS